MLAIHNLLGGLADSIGNLLLQCTYAGIGALLPSL